MVVFEITIAIFLAAILGSALARRFQLPLELTLLVGSLAVALVPGVPVVELDSHIIFFVFLPPILFAAAYFTSWREFKRHIRAITFLACGLVLFTVCGMAVAIKWLVPELTWPMAFLFGAIISPPDASAAATVTHKVGFPRRLHTILEGESLINDATALVCYRFALAALVTQEFHLGESVWQFLLVGVGGAVVGLAVAYAMLRLLTWVGDSRAEALLTLVMAFACYFVAESLHLSGVIATVAGGLYAGRALPRWASPETRVDAKALWSVVLLAVNALVFTLIGLQLPTVLKGIGDLPFQQLCVWAVVLTVAVIVIRFVWMFPAAWLPRKLLPGLAQRDPMPSFGELVVLGWTGMRGIVSLAAAIALPATLANGEPFTERPLIIFLAYAVTLLTLIVPTVTLPLLLRYFGICEHNVRLAEEVRARISMSAAATAFLQGLHGKGKYTDELLDDLERRYDGQLGRLRPNLDLNASSLLDPSEQQKRKLMLEVLESERVTLHQLRSRDELYDEYFHQLSDELDLETLRVRRNMRPL